MKKTYQQPTTTVCIYNMETQLLAGSLVLYDIIGDTDVQLSRRTKSFDDEEDEIEENTVYNSYNVWD